MRSLSFLLEEAEVVVDTRFKKQLEKAVKYLNTKNNKFYLSVFFFQTMPLIYYSKTPLIHHVFSI